MLGRSAYRLMCLEGQHRGSGLLAGSLPNLRRAASKQSNQPSPGQFHSRMGGGRLIGAQIML